MEKTYLRLVDWLNDALMKPLGPPPLGPFEHVVSRIGDAVCPVCGGSMGLHTIDHSTKNAVLHCPNAPLPTPLRTGPLNELGMPKHQS